VRAYGAMRNNNYDVNKVKVACSTFSVGLSNRTPGSEFIIEKTFHDVFTYAADSKIDNDIWDIIPKFENDEDDEDDQNVDLFSFLKIIGFQPKKKKKHIPWWDYCELLVRIVSDKYIKNSWPTQSFLYAVNSPNEFEGVVF
jgi:hypothetical protein